MSILENPTFREAIGKILRYGWFAVGTVMVHAGIWTDEELKRYASEAVLLSIGGISMAGPLVWSWLVTWYKNRKALAEKKKLLVAMAVPERLTENQVEAKIALGSVPPLNTPKDTVPVAPS